MDYEKKTFLYLLFILVYFSDSFSQHVSYDNYSGDWEDASTWSAGGVPVLTANTTVDIYGSVARNSDLSVPKDFTLDVYDTLIIYGDFTLAKDGYLNVHPGAFLIVYGNLTSAKDIEVDLSSYLVVLGDLTLAKDAAITTPAGDTLLYVTGTVDCTGGTCSGTDIGDEDDILNNPDLSDIIEATSSKIIPLTPTFCAGGGSVVLSIRNDGDAGTYQWFIDGVGQGLGSDVTFIATTAGSYDVEFDIGGITQNPDAVTVSSSGTASHSLSATITDESGVGAGDGAIDLTVTGGISPSYEWSNSATTEDITGLSAGDYTVTVTDGGCDVIDTYSVSAGCTAPTITGTTPASRCGTGTVGLSATASAGTIDWYNVATGGSSLGTGTTFTTPSISSTTSYWVDATDAGCTTASRTEIIATVIVSPVVDDIADPTICENYTLPVITGTNLTGNEAYYTATGGTGTQYNSGDAIISSTTLYIYDINGSCSSEESTTILIQPTPVTGPAHHISSSHMD